LHFARSKRYAKYGIKKEQEQAVKKIPKLESITTEFANQKDSRKKQKKLGFVQNTPIRKTSHHLYQLILTKWTYKKVGLLFRTTV